MRKSMHENNQNRNNIAPQLFALALATQLVAAVITIYQENFIDPTLNSEIYNQHVPTRRIPISTLPGSNGIDNPVTIINTGAAGSGHTRRQ